MAQTSYDLVPYTSHSYPQTHISHLYTIGRLLNLTPPPTRKSRVLEVGCALGGNIIPMAEEYPEAQFLGIDLSETQIRRGQDFATQLGLRNITLRAQSFLDFPETEGAFDYIICHGVLSWVAPEARLRLFKLVRRHLAPNGLAVVSYNTLPGWSAIHSLRNIMLYHTANFSSPADKIAQAQALLQFILDAQGEANNPYRTLVEQELAFLKSTEANYFFHDHLEEHNQPFYLHEFAATAAREGLAYVGDTDMPSMYLGNYKENVAKSLAGADDPIRVEQYLDFVNNRRFRSSILALGGTQVMRNIDAGRIEEFRLLSLLQPERAVADGVLPHPIELSFKASTGTSFTAREPVGAGLFLTLARHRGWPMSVNEVVAEAAERYRLNRPEAELRRYLCDAALRIFLMRGLHLRSEPSRHAAALSQWPAALRVARAQAAWSSHVTNAFHDDVALDPITRLMLPALDGSRDRDALVALLIQAVTNGQMKIDEAGKPVTEPAAIARYAGQAVDGMLNFVLAAALLAS